MITKSISLAPPYEKAGLSGEGLSPTLTCIIHDSQPERKYPALIAIPGGMSTAPSERESHAPQGGIPTATTALCWTTAA